LSYLGHDGVEVINDEGVHGVAGMLRPPEMYIDRCSASSQTASVSCGKNDGGEPSNLVPGQRRGIVAD